jgi:hypothetical protein
MKKLLIGFALGLLAVLAIPLLMALAGRDCEEFKAFNGILGTEEDEQYKDLFWIE